MTGTSGRPDERRPGAPAIERLSAWAGARAAPDATDAARVLEQVSGQRPELTTKRSLVAVSHAIERAVLAAPHAEPTIVLALFQRMEYFERERAVYERIARTGARVAVAFCDGPEHPLPDGVTPVVLDPGGQLVDEWSVVAVTPQAGAFLVATDQHVIEPGAPSLEAGRRFRSRWGFSRVQATVELARLRLVLGDRLPADMVRTIDRLLGETMSAGADPAGSAGTPQEVWATTAAFHLAERLVSARTGSARLRAQLADAHAAAAARHAAGVDAQSGLTTPDFLHRWSDGEGTTVLPVGIGLFDLPAVTVAGRDGADPRAAYHAARRIAAAVTQPLGPVDAAVRLSETEFLVVLPGASELHLARVCDDVLEQLTLASDGYPHVPLAGRLATTVTRHRPLPLPELRRALAAVEDDRDPGPRTAGTTAAGDVIVVCSTGSADGPGDDDSAAPGSGSLDDAGPGIPDRPEASGMSGRSDGIGRPDGADWSEPVGLSGRSDGAGSADRADVAPRPSPGGVAANDASGPDASRPGDGNGQQVIGFGRFPRPSPYGDANAAPSDDGWSPSRDEIDDASRGRSTEDDGTPGRSAGDDGARGRLTGDDGARGRLTGDDGTRGRLTGDDTAPGHSSGDDGAIGRFADRRPSGSSLGSPSSGAGPLAGGPPGGGGATGAGAAGPHGGGVLDGDVPDRGDPARDTPARDAVGWDDVSGDLPRRDPDTRWTEPPPWRTRRSEDTAGSAVDEVRNLFGRRS